MNEKAIEVWKYLYDKYNDVPESVEQLAQMMTNDENVKLVAGAIKDQFPDLADEAALKQLFVMDEKKKDVGDIQPPLLPSEESGEPLGKPTWASLEDGTQPKKVFDGLDQFYKPLPARTKQPAESNEQADVVITPTEEQQSEQQPEQQQDEEPFALVTKPAVALTTDQKKKIIEYNRLLSDVASTMHYMDDEGSEFSFISPELEEILDERKGDVQRELRANYNKLIQLKKELEEDGVVTQMGDNLKWITYDTEVNDDTKIGVSERILQFMYGAQSNSILGNISKLVEGAIDKNIDKLPEDVRKSYEWAKTHRDLILQRGETSKVEQYLQTGVGFLIDSPVFMGLGGVGGAVAKTGLGTATRAITRQLLKTGVSAPVAERLAARTIGNSLLARTGGSMAASSVTLGGYEGGFAAVSELNRYLEDGGSLEAYNWNEVLKSTAHGTAMGLGVGAVNPLFSRFGDYTLRGVENTLARKAIKLGINTGEFVSETAVFAGMGAMLDDRMPKAEDFVDAVGTLLTIKLTNLPMKVRSKYVKAKKIPDVEYTQYELRKLGVKSREGLHKLNNSELVERIKDPEISEVTKNKMLLDIAGVYPKGVMSYDRVEMKEFPEEGRYYIREYDGDRLINEVEHTDRHQALEHLKKDTRVLRDVDVKKRMDEATPEQYLRYTSEMDKIPAKEREKMLDAVDKKADERTAEETRLADRWYGIVENVLKESKVEEPKVKEPEQKGVEAENIPVKETAETKKEIERVEPKEKVEEPIQEEPVKKEEVREEPTKEKVTETENADVKQGEVEPVKPSETDVKSVEAESEAVEGEQPKRKRRTKIERLEDLADELKAELQERKGNETETRKALDKFYKKHWKEIKKLDNRLTRYVLDIVNSKETVEKKISRLDKVIADSERAREVAEITDEIGKLKKQHVTRKEKKVLESMSPKTQIKRATKLQHEYIEKIGRVEVDELPPEMMNEIRSVVDELKKESPDYTMVKNFFDKYTEMYKKKLAKKKVIDITEEKPEESLEEKVSYLEKKFEFAETEMAEVERGGMTEYLKSLEQGYKKMNREINTLKKSGAVRVNERGELEPTDLVNGVYDKETQKRVKELTERFNNLQVKIKQKVANDVLGVESYPVSDADARLLDDIKRQVKRIKNDEWAMKQLNMNDMQLLEDVSTNASSYSVFPNSWYKLKEKLETTELASTLNKEFYSKIKLGGLDKKNLNRIKASLNRNNPYRLVPEIGIDNIFKPVGKMIYNPLDIYVYQPVSAARRQSRELYNEMVRPLYQKILGTNWFKRNVVQLNKRHNYHEGAVVGILQRQLAAVERINSQLKRNITKTKDGYVIVDPDGDVMRDANGNPLRFDTFDEAYDHSQRSIIQKIGNGRPLDAYDISRWEIDPETGKRIDSRTYLDSQLSKTDEVDRFLKETADNAYKELVERSKKLGKGDNLSWVKSEEDVKSLLTNNEYDIYKITHDRYEKLWKYVDEIGKREGIVVERYSNYFPEKLYSKKSGKGNVESVPDVAKEILPKSSPFINYTNYDAINAFETYVKDIGDSYYAIPKVRVTLDALELLKKDKGRKQEFTEIVRENVEAGCIAEFHNKSLFGDVRKVVPISKDKKLVMHVSDYFKLGAQAFRNLAMGSIKRTPIDYLSNVIKYGSDAFRKDIRKWDRFFDAHKGEVVVQAIEGGSRGSFGIGEEEVKGAKLENFTKYLPAIGDVYPSRRAWINAFEKAYSKFSSEKFDLNRYYTDEAYRKDVQGSDAWRKAMGMANGYVEDITVPTTEITAPREISFFLWKMSNSSRVAKMLGAMNRYAQNEGNKFRSAFRSRDTKYMFDSQLRLLFSNMAFNVSSQTVYNLMRVLGGYASGDDNLKKDAMADLKRMFTGQSTLENAMVSVAQLAMSRYMNLGRIFMGVLYNASKSIKTSGMDSKEKYRFEQKMKNFEKWGKRIFPMELNYADEYIPADAFYELFGYYGVSADRESSTVKDGLDALMHYFIYDEAKQEALPAPKTTDIVAAFNDIFLSTYFPETNTIRQLTNAISIGETIDVPKELIGAYSGIVSFRLTALDAKEYYNNKFKELEEEYVKHGTVKGKEVEDERQAYDIMDKIARKAMKYYLDLDENAVLWKYGKEYASQLSMLERFALTAATNRNIKYDDRQKMFEMIHKAWQTVDEHYHKYLGSKGNMKNLESLSLDKEFFDMYYDMEVDKYLKSINKETTAAEMFSEYDEMFGGGEPGDGEDE